MTDRGESAKGQDRPKVLLRKNACSHLRQDIKLNGSAPTVSDESINAQENLRADQANSICGNIRNVKPENHDP